MATQLFLSTGAAPYTPATLRGAWDDSAGAVTRALEATKRSCGAITSVARAEANATDEYDVLLFRGISAPLAAQTLSGTVDVLLAVLESNSAANLHWHLHIYVTQGDSDTVRGTLLADYREALGVNEWTTGAAGRALAAAQAISSLAVSAGDRLVVEIGYTARNTVTTSYTGTLYYGARAVFGNSVAMDAPDLSLGGTGVSVSAGFLSFSADLAFAVGLARAGQFGAETILTSPSAPVRAGQFGAEVLVAAQATARVGQFGLEVLLRVPPNEEVQPETGQSFGPLVWVEWSASDGTTRVWAPVDLPDPSTYYHGYKAPKLLRPGVVVRALSDEDGEYKGQFFDVDVDDTNRDIRTLLGRRDSRRLILNTRLVMRMISDEDRRAQLRPRTVAIGRLRSYGLN